MKNTLSEVSETLLKSDSSEPSEILKWAPLGGPFFRIVQTPV